MIIQNLHITTHKNLVYQYRIRSDMVYQLHQILLLYAVDIFLLVASF